MEIKECYYIECNLRDLCLEFSEFPVGPRPIMWFNYGSIRFISKEQVENAVSVLTDMELHKGPDTENPRIKFFWDDAKPTL